MSFIASFTYAQSLYFSPLSLSPSLLHSLPPSLSPSLPPFLLPSLLPSLSPSLVQSLFSGCGDIYRAMAAQIMGKASVSTVTVEERNKAKVICLGELTIRSFNYFVGSGGAALMLSASILLAYH